MPTGARPPGMTRPRTRLARRDRILGQAIIVKLAYRHGVDAVTLISYRMLFALPLVVALAAWAGRGRPAFFKRKTTPRQLVALGVS